MSDESIFAAALSKAPGDVRRAFLDGACGGNEALRRRVERLLEADDRTGGILERGPDAGVDGPHALPADARAQVPGRPHAGELAQHGQTEHADDGDSCGGGEFAAMFFDEGRQASL